METCVPVIVEELERINYNPSVFAYSFFKVADEETNIRGYWKDTDGRVYVDNIHKVIIPEFYKPHLESVIQLAFWRGEKAVFYKDIFNRGIIKYLDGTSEMFETQIHIVENKKPSQAFINVLLSQHGGITIYALDNGKYLIEIYKP